MSHHLIKEENPRAAKRLKTDQQVDVPQSSPSVVASSATATVTPDRTKKKNRNAMKREEHVDHQDEQTSRKKQRTQERKSAMRSFAAAATSVAAEAAGPPLQCKTTNGKQAIKAEPKKEVTSQSPTAGMITRSKRKKAVVGSPTVNTVDKTTAITNPTPVLPMRKKKPVLLRHVNWRIPLFAIVAVLLAMFGFWYTVSPTSTKVQEDTNEIVKKPRRSIGFFLSRVLERKQKRAMNRDSDNNSEKRPPNAKRIRNIWHSLTNSNPADVTHDSILLANTVLN